MTLTHMRREIAEQPDAVARTIAALRPLGPQVRSLVGSRRHVLFIARGTSDNAAVYAQYLCSTRTGRLASLASPSVATVYDAELDLSDVVAVAVSQSGGTEEIVETLDWASRSGAATIAVTNSAGSPLAAGADLALVTRAGTELAVPATKTYTTQLAALAVLAFSISDDARMLDELEGMPAVMAGMLDTADGAEELASRLVGADRIVVSARGYASSTALELALKLQETCYVTALGLSYADLLHGPIAVVRPHTPTLLVAARGDERVLPGMTEVARRCVAVGADVHGIGGDDEFAAACGSSLPGPDAIAELAPIPLVIPGQLLTEALARAKGLDPDQPHGLQKVTQTA